MPSYFKYANKDILRAMLTQEPENGDLDALVKTYPNNHGGLIITDDASANAVKTLTKGVNCFDIGKDRQLIPAGELLSFLSVANVWEVETWGEKVAGNVISGDSERMMAVLDSLRTMSVLSTRITSFGCPWDFYIWFSALPSQLKEEHKQRVVSKGTPAFEDSEFDVSKVNDGQVRGFLQRLEYGELLDDGYFGGQTLALALTFGLNYCYQKKLGTECEQFLEILLSAAKNVSSLRKDKDEKAPASHSNILPCLKGMAVLRWA